MPTEITQPKPGSGDAVHTIAKIVLSAIPGVGGPAAELFSALIVPPLTKKRNEWVQSIADGLKALEEKIEGFSLESLRGHEEFVTSVMHATQAALRNHQKEKREALRNAVLNVASSRAPDEDLQMMFLSVIDTLTPWHLHMLRFFQDPKAYGTTKGITYPDYFDMGRALDETFPELREQKLDFYEQLVKDLFDRGLITAGSFRGRMPLPYALDKQTTEMGDQSLAFISSPLY